MWANKAASNLQKTYDESYLTCSTAVYYEGQGNEKEAMRYWKNALDQISHNSPSKPGYAPKSETERALVDSLKTLETQCKERIDLLEALRVSREANPTPRASSSTRPTGSPPAESCERGWIGGGTIPAISYTELSRPALPPRPSFPSRTSSDKATVGRTTSGAEQMTPSSASRSPAQLPPYASSTPRKKASRSPSPDKRTMRTTLRPGRSDKTTKTPRRSAPRASEKPGASKAATLAWTGIPARENNGRSSTPDLVTHSSTSGEPNPSEQPRKLPLYTQWDSHTRRLVKPVDNGVSAMSSPDPAARSLEDHPFPGPSSLALGAASSALNSMSLGERHDSAPGIMRADRGPKSKSNSSAPLDPAARSAGTLGSEVPSSSGSSVEPPLRRKPITRSRNAPLTEPQSAKRRVARRGLNGMIHSSSASDDDELHSTLPIPQRRAKGKQHESPLPADISRKSSDGSTEDEGDDKMKTSWEQKKKSVLKRLPPGVDNAAAKAIFNEIVVEGDEVHWSDVAGLEIAKNALREAVVYPFLRPDLFMGLREPARGMLLFGPPGTGKTMLARAVATESKSTFFSISASSLTSKYLGESEKLVRALFALAKAMAPSIIFVDEIDSLLSQRSGSGEHEATQRIKTEFLIQWSDLQRAAAGRESSPSPGGKNGEGRGDANRVLVLAATNLPWAIDDAARRRFVRRQYIPLPEPETRATQLRTLLGQQKHSLTDADITELVQLTDGFSGSDITALAKDAAMGPLRSLGEALLHMTMDQIRPIELGDFRASLRTIRPSVSKEGLKEYENWAAQFGERGG